MVYIILLKELKVIIHFYGVSSNDLNFDIYYREIILLNNLQKVLAIVFCLLKSYQQKKFQGHWS